MRPGYYTYTPMGFPLEVTGDGEYRTMTGETWDFGRIPPDDLRPATLKELIQNGTDFDDAKVVTPHIAWASDENAEEWNDADDEDEAIEDARNEGLERIWICDKPVQADPRDVVPDVEWVIESMLDSCDDDNSMFYAASQGGWLDLVTLEQKADLNVAIERTICDWLIRHGHWPAGFVVTGRDVRRVEVVGEEGSR